MQFSFSDTNVYHEYAVFIFLLMIAFLGFQFSILNKFFQHSVEFLVKFCREKCAFKVYDITNEYKRIDVVRILVGFIATSRYWEIFQSNLILGGTSPYISGFALICSICIMIGLYTPVVSFLLMSTANILIDNILGTSTLGTMILSMILFAFVLFPAGYSYSLDSILIKHSNFGGVWVQKLYDWVGKPSTDRALVTKFFTLFSYWLLCLYSVTLHFNDPAWISGHTLTWILLSPTHNPLTQQFFYSVYSEFPTTLILFNQLVMYLMLLWYFIFLPGLFMGRYIQSWIIYWSLAFWAISAFILPLSYLGWYELCLWLLIFLASPFIANFNKSKLIIFYDDRCNLCDSTVRFLSKIDLAKTLSFKSIRQFELEAESYGISLREGLADMYAINPDTRKKYIGYDLYNHLSGKLFLLLPFKLIFFIGKITRLGPISYRYIADRRTKLFGICEPSQLSYDLLKNSAQESITANYPAYFKALILVLLILSIAFIVKIPFLGEGSDNHPIAKASKNIFGAASLAYGVGEINVFNMQDMELMYVNTEIIVQGQELNGIAKLGGNAFTSEDSKGFYESDRERYTIAAFGRKNSRMNLRCNTEYFEVILSELSKYKQIPFLKNGLIVNLFYVSIPTLHDLSNYKFTPISKVPLCSATINIIDKKIQKIEYFQEGIDAVMKSKGYQPILNPQGAGSLNSFPCTKERQYLGKIYDALAPALDKESLGKLSAAVASMNEQAYGEFELECLIKVHKVDKIINELTSRQIINLPELSVCKPEMMGTANYYIGILHKKRSTQLNNLDFKQDDLNCAEKFQEIRRLYWSSILKK